MFCCSAGDLRPHRCVARRHTLSTPPSEGFDAGGAPEHDVVGIETGALQQVQYIIGGVDVELTRQLDKVAGGATAHDDMPHTTDGGELPLHRLGSLRRYVGAELEHVSASVDALVREQLFWSRMYSRMNPGTTMTAAPIAATSRALSVPDGAAASSTSRLSGRMYGHCATPQPITMLATVPTANNVAHWWASRTSNNSDAAHRAPR